MVILSIYLCVYLLNFLLIYLSCAGGWKGKERLGERGIEGEREKGRESWRGALGSYIFLLLHSLGYP